MIDHTAPEVKPIDPKPVLLPPGKTALLVMEMSEYCSEPDYFCTPLVPGIGKLIERARAAGVPVAYTIPLPWKGQPHGQVYSGFKRRFSEPVFFLPGFDKLFDGQIQGYLKLFDIDTLVLVGGKANLAIMATATTATSMLKYNVVIPVDGIAATTEYEKEYALYEFRVYPDGSYKRFSFTMIDDITFQSAKI